MPVVGEETIVTPTPGEVGVYGSGKGPKSFVPLREDPTAGDAHDAKRAAMVLGRWTAQDQLLRHYYRSIEENIRMISGQQWSMWNPLLQRWMDVSEWMSAAEQRWRLRTSFNRLLPWFMITHARATESQPILTMLPGPDRIDAELAEVMDISFKTLWREIGMSSVHAQVMAWVVAAGRGLFASRVDPNRGPMREWMGQGQLPVLDDGLADLRRDPNTGEPVMSDEVFPNVPFGPDGTPFDAQGNALAVLTPDGPMQLGEPHKAPEGEIVVDVFSPLQCRGSWGPQPWYQKPEHMTKQYLTPEEIWEQWGVDIEPDAKNRAGSGEVGELERMLYGAGFYGAVSGLPAQQMAQGNTDGYVEVTTLWQAPKPYGGMEKTKDSPGGRVTVVAKGNRVLHDGVRPVAYRYTSPIRCIDFVQIPGRPAGTTPVEAMVPQQRAFNRTLAQIGEHTNLCTNPKPIIDAQSGIATGNWTNEPGVGFVANRRASVPAIEWVSPPALSTDVFKYLELLVREIDNAGQLAGAGGEPPSDDPSGELIKELRFNSDRYFGPTMRAAVEEYARFGEDIRVTLPVVWDREKLLNYAGEDNVARTLVVMPYMFAEGKVDIVPDAESMLPEGRGDRQARVYKMYMDGLFGQPGSPEARKIFFDLGRFPHLSRTAKPGGIDRIMADQFNGRLLRGESAQALPFFPWYDAPTHLAVLADFMKSPEFLKQSREIQANFVFRFQTIQQVIAAAQMQQMQQQLAMQEEQARAQAVGKGGGEEREQQSMSQGPPSTPSGVDRAPTAV